MSGTYATEGTELNKYYNEFEKAGYDGHLRRMEDLKAIREQLMSADSTDSADSE